MKVISHDFSLTSSHASSIFSPQRLKGKYMHTILKYSFRRHVTWPSRPRSGRSPSGRWQYAAVKAAYLNASQTCAAQGVGFVPLVESTAWDPPAEKALQLLSRAAAARADSDAGLLRADLLQEVSVLSQPSAATMPMRPAGQKLQPRPVPHTPAVVRSSILVLP